MKKILKKILIMSALTSALANADTINLTENVVLKVNGMKIKTTSSAISEALEKAKKQKNFAIYTVDGIQVYNPEIDGRPIVSEYIDVKPGTTKPTISEEKVVAIHSTLIFCNMINYAYTQKRSSYFSTRKSYSLKEESEKVSTKNAETLSEVWCTNDETKKIPAYLVGFPTPPVEDFRATDNVPDELDR